MRHWTFCQGGKAWSLNNLMSSKPLNQTSLNIGIHSETITKAAKRMARIFVRLFSSYFQVADLAELVMQAGVEEAERRCRSELPDKKPTLSRLSLMTGIPTAKVKHLQEEPRQASDYYICAEAAILARWAKEPSLRSRVSGEPADLPIFGNEGSFQGLVGRIAGRGISTKTALDRLLANGNVRVVNKHFVRLIDPNWRYIEDDEDVFLDYATLSMTGLASAFQNNLKHRKDPSKKWVERRAYSLQIQPEKRGELSEKINKLLHCCPITQQ